MTKWKSKITGSIYNAVDSFSTNGRDYEYSVAIFLNDDNFDTDRPRARLTIDKFLEAFERVEDEKPVQEGIYDGWDTE